MSFVSSLSVGEAGLEAALEDFFRRLLAEHVVDAVVVPARATTGGPVMPTLFVEPGECRGVDPFAPVAPVSGATILSRLTRRPSNRRIAAWLRPCEVRAFLELVKLEQASLENVLLLSGDCFGRYENPDYAEFFSEEGMTTSDFLRAATNGRGTELTDGVDVVSACRTCTSPVPEAVDVRIDLAGHELEESLGIEALTPAGEAALTALGTGASSSPPERKAAVAALLGSREEARRARAERLGAQMRDVAGLKDALSNCVECLNCRMACPVCYCRTCVFATETFDHEGRQYLGWAAKRGRLQLPSDTLFYHLTRMAHVGTICVGCGQCTSACPNDVPVADLFGLVGPDLQQLFEYVPGRDREEAQPLAHFAEGELSEVTGGSA